MAENSKIEWTDHTFNAWHGCVKVSAGCKHCYADAQDRRFGPSHWGPGAERKLMSAAYWRQPLRWNRDAEAAGVRRKVFCASMSDVFERLPIDHPSGGGVEESREKLWALTQATPHLDWLLLTKRPENILPLVPSRWLYASFPDNVWIGTSVEDQAAADTRIPHLLRVPARVRFLSCEPLLGPVDLRDGLRIAWQCSGCRRYFGEPLQELCPHCGRAGYWTGSHAFNPKGGQVGSGISWVICGGESGHGARPMHPDWARSLRDQCQAAGVPFFFKQWGEWLPAESMPYRGFVYQTADGLPSAEVYTARLSVGRHVVCQPSRDGNAVDRFRVGKHAAGRHLDGRQWNEMPGGDA